MAILNEDSLGKLLKTDPQQNVWFLCGDDAYLKEFYCNKLVSQTVDEAMRMFNFHTYEDGDTPLPDIFADAETLPMMSEKTCLLVKDYPLDELGKEQRAELEKNLRNIPETTVMVFYCGNADITYDRRKNAKWCDIMDLFQKVGVVAELSHRTPQKIARMLMKAAPERGTTIGQEEAEYLIGVVGEDIQVLLNEFNKVCAFADGAPVTREMIDQTAVKTVEASVFDISEAIFTGKTDQAFAIVQELLRKKTPAQPIIGALAGAYVNLYRLQTAYAADKNVSDFAETMGYKGNSSYALKKLAGFTRKIPRAAVKESIDILLEADVKSKSAAVDPAILLSEVLARLSAAAAR